MTFPSFLWLIRIGRVTAAQAMRSFPSCVRRQRKEALLGQRAPLKIQNGTYAARIGVSAELPNAQIDTDRERMRDRPRKRKLDGLNKRER
jgi:hypothetical protein